MTGAKPFIVVNHLGGWRLRREGWQSRRYRSQADALRVARELAASTAGRPRILLQLGDGTLEPVPCGTSNGVRTAHANGQSPLTFYLDDIQRGIAVITSNIERQSALLAGLADRYPEAEAGREFLAVMERRRRVLTDHLRIMAPIAKRLAEGDYHGAVSLKPHRDGQFTVLKGMQPCGIIRRAGLLWLLQRFDNEELHDITAYSSFELPAIAAVVGLYLDGYLPGPAPAESDSHHMHDPEKKGE